jgi:hypothetical protein
MVDIQKINHYDSTYFTVTVSERIDKVRWELHADYELYVTSMNRYQTGSKIFSDITPQHQISKLIIFDINHMKLKTRSLYYGCIFLHPLQKHSCYLNTLYH